MDPKFDPFRARAPWFGADLQTLRNTLVTLRVELPRAHTREEVVPLSDGSGDALAVRIDEPIGVPRGPVIVLVHGLAGCEESAYMQLSARHWLARGHRVARINLRGSGPSRRHCRLQYHAGRTEDLRDVLQTLELRMARDASGDRGSGWALVGYSLGGNIVLKFLAEFGDALPVRAAASVSAPIDLAAASRRFLAPRNRLYHQHLLRSMKSECEAGAAVLSDDERARVRAARSIYEFDDVFVAPRNGFRDAEHYYAENEAQRFLRDIGVPTLLIHARDDPWIPADAYERFAWQENDRLQPLLSPGGGHVGFHGRTRHQTWHDHWIDTFFSEQGL